MDAILGKAMESSGGIAEIAGEKAGELVEGVVKKVMGGKDGENNKEEGEGGGGLDFGNVLNAVGGSQEKEGGGTGDAIKGAFGKMF